MCAVEANFLSLKEYLCDATGVARGNGDHRSINVYPYLGSKRTALAPNDVVGFDLNNDGRLDAYTAVTQEALHVFVVYANLKGIGGSIQEWGTPIVISGERFRNLTQSCEEISTLQQGEQIGDVVAVAGLVVLVVGALLNSGAIAVLGLSAVVVGIVSSFNRNAQFLNMSSALHQTMLQYLPATTTFSPYRVKAPSDSSD